MTDDEYSKYLSLGKGRGPVASEPTVLDTDDLPESVNWVTKGAVNPPINEGQCGATWAISAVAVVEGHHKIKTGKLFQLSVQQIIDCDGDGAGCSGGWPNKALEYVHKAGGLALASEYTYKASQGQCIDQKFMKYAKVEEVVSVPANSKDQLKAAIAKGPVSVSVEADHREFQTYTSGILNS